MKLKAFDKLFIISSLISLWQFTFCDPLIAIWGILNIIFIVLMCILHVIRFKGY